MDYKVEIQKVIDRQVTLPVSKSVAARALIINALVGEAWNEEGGRCPERCDDIDIMATALKSDGDYINVGAAGTAMRFLTAYFACQDGRIVTLDGSERMRQRPIEPLVDALRQMGASIEYLGNEGFPPLKIAGRKLHGCALTMRGDVSSQFVSAILMVAPLAGGITLTIEGNIVSRPYIDMTLAIMRHYGIEACAVGENQIVVPDGHYVPAPYYIEGDWSAASYWFALKALLPQSLIVLSPLFENSLQGDRAIVEMMEPLGVKAQFKEDGVITLFCTKSHTPQSLRDSSSIFEEQLRNCILGHSSPSKIEGEGGSMKSQVVGCHTPAGLVPTLRHYNRDMAATPDLVPTLAVTLCLLRVPFTLTGVATLRIKESDRLEALREELAKLGYSLDVGDNSLCYNGNYTEIKDVVTLDPHGDHRMAMALSLAATRHPGITIKNAEVVAKSYPDFWKHFAGFARN